MLKVLLCTVREHTDDKWLNDKLLQLTHSQQIQLSQRAFKVEIIDSVQELNNFIDDYDLIFVQTAGDIIFETEYIHQKILNFPEDVGIMGHLIWYPNELPYLHEQAFIINTKALKGKKLDFSVGTDFGPLLVRSEFDMHDGHAPFWISYGSEVGKRELNFGVKIFTTVLDNGYKVCNFDDHWRYPEFSVLDPFVTPELREWLIHFEFKRVAARGYCYPKLNVELFTKAIKNLEVYNDLDPLHKFWIEGFKAVTIGHNKVVNLYNADATTNLTEANRILCPANGLLGEIEALTTGADTIIFFDFNKNNTDFKKHLYKNWNGVDYKTFAESWAYERGLIIEPRLESSQKFVQAMLPNYKRVEENWDVIKKKTIEIHNINLITDAKLITDKIVNKSIIHTSTILTYYLASQVSNTTDQIQACRDLIVQAVESTNSHWQEVV